MTQKVPGTNWKWAWVAVGLTWAAAAVADAPMWTRDAPRHAPAYTNGLLAEAEFAPDAIPPLRREEYPDADTVIVASRQATWYDTNGWSVVWDDTVTEALTEKGKRSLQTVSLHYQAAYGDAAVTRLDILRPDGAVTPVDVTAHSRVMIAPGQMSENIYDPNQKVLEVGVPGVEIGDRVRQVTRRTETKSRLPGAWSDFTVFEAPTPIRRAVYEVYEPSARPLVHRRLKSAWSNTVAGVATPGDGFTLHRWEARDVPQLFEEPQMPAYYTVAQRLLLSTIPDWPAVSRWYDRLSEPRLNAVTPDMRAETKRLTAACATPEERLRAVFDFVSRDIRYMGLTLEDEAPGYEPHDVSLTFSNRYGVCRDKAALLAALLRLAEIEAHPTLIHAGPKLDPDVPMLFFNHAIVAARLPGDPPGAWRLMDPTDESTRDLLPAYLGNCSYLVATPEGEPLRVSPVAPAGENLVTAATDAALDAAGGVRAVTRLRFDGVNDNIYRGHFARLKPDERRQFFEGLVKRVYPGARLESFRLLPEPLRDTGAPLIAEFAFTAPDVVVAGADLALAPAPWLGGAVGAVQFALGALGLEERRFPLVTGFACGVAETFTLRLPETFGPPRSLPVYAPAAAGPWQRARALSWTNGLLRGESRFTLEAPELTPAEYLALKGDLKRIERDSRQQPLFVYNPATTAANTAAAARPPPEPPAADALDEADIRIVSDELDVDLEDATHWTETRRRRWEALTYAGIKTHAELKIPYQPAWETVELVAARVGAPGGAWQEISSNEIVRMDQPWAGGAPRYPAGKMLVVSFPNVALGSTVEYTLRRQVRGRTAFALQEALQGYEPIAWKKITLRAPADLPLRIAAPEPAREERAGDRIARTWEIQDREPLRREPDAPPPWALFPTLQISAADWPTLAAPLVAALRAASENQPAAAEQARALMADIPAGDDAARARALRDFVMRRIRPAGPVYSDLPLTALTPADRTLADGYGHAADRAILLCALLRAAGFAPEWVFAPGSDLADEVFAPLLETPRYDVFPSVLLRVKTADGREWYLNDSDQYAELGVTAAADRTGWRPESNRFEPIRPPDMFRNRSELEIDLTPRPDAPAALRLTRRHFGPQQAAFKSRYAELPPEERRRHHLELLAAIAQNAVADGPLVTELDAYPGIERYAMNIADYAVRQGDYLVFSLPFISPNELGLRGDTRRTPLHWGAPRRQAARYLVRLPPDAKPVIRPSNLVWGAPGGGRIEWTARDQDGGVWEFACEMDLPARQWTAADYPALLEINRQLSHPRRRLVVARLGATAGSHGPAVTTHHGGAEDTKMELNALPPDGPH